MSDAIVTAAISVAGLLVLTLALVIIAVRGKSSRAVSWQGFGVRFEITPCSKCPELRQRES